MSASFNVNTESGHIEPARQCPSPNHDARPDDAEPAMLVVHGISLPPGEFGSSGGGTVRQVCRLCIAGLQPQGLDAFQDRVCGTDYSRRERDQENQRDGQALVHAFSPPG